MPGFLKNRIRTITGTDAGFFQSVYYLLSYCSYQLFYGNILSKLINKFFARPVNYASWLESSITADKEAGIPIHILSKGSTVLPESGYVVIANSGDQFRRDALPLLSRFIISNDFPELISFDFDEVNQKGTHQSPHFNPAWSPHTLAQSNYLQNAYCAKVELFKEEIPLTPEAQYAWLQSLSEKGIRSLHCQEVLLHKQQIKLLKGNTIIQHDSAKLVSIIIPTRNKSFLVKQSVDAILNITTYANFEIVLVDNASNEAELLELLKLYKERLGKRFVQATANIPFNFSALINLGVAHASGDYFVFLNNDTSVITPDWIERMLSKFNVGKTGAVGAKLLYPNHTIQHAGIILDPDIISRHIYLGKAEHEREVSTDRNYTAVTAACMMVSREVFHKVGGFDAAFAVNYNDIDFCLRLMQAQYYNVYAADVVLYHYESASRQHPFASWLSGKHYRHESALMRKKWQKLIEDDPYYSKLNNRFAI